MARNGARGKGDRFSEELLESENDRLIHGMAGKVSSLKHIALDLRTEAKDQVNMIDDSTLTGHKKRSYT
ncbi:hypothetical protein GBAR_LOCUS15437 [Geodia barretti]|uniref:t-SNARE coiled-coil homology domain-containing protein n=1 Tax=Geodia barretti TaxID=519541 RepID=A0AA35WU99_GEOBA|nr:hypothetical protein GBAR_LOCUS15437 [Geodia barretti]